MSPDVDGPDVRWCLESAMTKMSASREDVAALSDEHFGGRKWSDLKTSERWGLVLLVDPKATGPFGYSMEPF